MLCVLNTVCHIQCLRCHGEPEGAVMMDKFSQFLSEKFLYDQEAAMKLLVQCGLKEQLFDLAKVGVTMYVLCAMEYVPSAPPP